MNGNTPLQSMSCGPYISDMFGDLINDVYNSLEGGEGVSVMPDIEPERIPYEHVDGFIPFTDGGYRHACYADAAALMRFAGKWPAALRDVIQSGYQADMVNAVNYDLEDSGEAPISHYDEAVSLLTHGHTLGRVSGMENWQPLPGMTNTPVFDKRSVRTIPDVEGLNTSVNIYLQESPALYAVRASAMYYQNGHTDTDGTFREGPVISFSLHVNTDFEYYRESVAWLRRPVQYDIYRHYAPLKTLDGPALEQIKQDMLTAFFGRAV